MSKISKPFWQQRLTILIILFLISTIALGIFTAVYHNKNIVKTNITISLNDDTEEIFEYHFKNNKKLYKYYNYEVSSDSKNSDIVFTSDINMIDTTRDYSQEGYSPLVVCLKDVKNLNNYLKTTTKEGFLTSANGSKIKNSSSDEITCDFLRIIEAVLNGEDWSDLGGEDKKITIYCPESNTIAGNLFYEFLLITINNGKYPTDNIEQIKQKADLFLASDNTIQTDVRSKISKLNGTLLEEDIYVLFESDLILETKGKGDICVTYPETTVIKQLYLQYNNSDLKEPISKILHASSSISNHLRYNFYYRSSEYPDLINNYGDTLYFNVQKGFNHYELTK